MKGGLCHCDGDLLWRLPGGQQATAAPPRKVDTPPATSESRVSPPFPGVFAFCLGSRAGRTRPDGVPFRRLVELAMSDLGATTRTATLARVPGTADTRARARRPSVSADTRTDVAPSLSLSARAVRSRRSRRTIAPPARAVRSRRLLAPHARAACSRRSLAPHSLPARASLARRSHLALFASRPRRVPRSRLTLFTSRSVVSVSRV